MCYIVLPAARSCTARDNNNKDNVCTPTIPAGLKRPPPSKTLSIITWFGTILNSRIIPVMPKIAFREVEEPWGESNDDGYDTGDDIWDDHESEPTNVDDS